MWARQILLADCPASRKGGARRRRLLGERSALVALREDARVISTDATRLAVLIDSDNTTAGLATELLEEIAKYGTPIDQALPTATGPSRSSPDGRSSGCARRPVIGTGCRASWLLSGQDRVVEIHH